MEKTQKQTENGKSLQWKRDNIPKLMKLIHWWCGAMMRSSLNFSNEEMEDDKFVKKKEEKKCDWYSPKIKWKTTTEKGE